MNAALINTAVNTLRKDNFSPETGFANDIWIEKNSGSTDQIVSHKKAILKNYWLPSTYRTVFNLHVIDGYTHLEISHHLEISVATSKLNLAQARLLLQEDIHQNYLMAAVR